MRWCGKQIINFADKSMSEDDHPLAPVISKTSLDLDVEENLDAHSYTEYIRMLKNNNKVISMALRKAEDLIGEYRHDNNELKQRNSFLEKELQELQDEVEYLKQMMFANSSQNTLQEQVKQLRNHNSQVQSKMKALSQELEKSQNRIRKLTKNKQEAIEKNFHNLFEFGVPSSMQDHSDLRKEEGYLKDIRSLKWKLQQRQDQITYLIKANNTLQSKLKSYQQTNTNLISFKGQDKFVTKHRTEERVATCSTSSNPRRKAEHTRVKTFGNHNFY